MIRLAIPQAKAARSRLRIRSAAAGVDAAGELERCAADPGYFIHNYCIIDRAQEEGGEGKGPFHLWDDQRGVLRDLHANRLVVILKARQLGISWLVCGYVLWLCTFHRGKVVLLFSKGKLEANELVRRITVMHQRLPGWLRAASPLAKPPLVAAVFWANESRVSSLPATPTAGSSFEASLVIMDEAAKMTYASQLYTSAKPTIDNGGRLIVLSSAWGAGNLFHDLYTQAVEGKNGFRDVFLPWWSRPDRDDAWYGRMVAQATDPAKVKQEYPANPNEAFLHSGRVRFPAEWLEQQGRNAAAARVLSPADPGHPRGISHFEGLSVYSPPLGGRRYVLSADVAEGIEDGDYDSAVAFDRETRSEHATLHGLWEPSEYARRLATLADAYDAVIVVERNNHGHAVLLKLMELCPRRVARGMDGRPGWVTSSNKPQMVDILAEALRDNAMAVRSQATVHEMQIYRVTDNGGTEAPSGHHDDRVMMWAVGLAWCRLAPARERLRSGPNPVADYRG